MIKIQNNRKSTIKVGTNVIAPLGQVVIADEEWKAEFVKSKPLRDAVSQNFLTISKASETKEIDSKKKGSKK